MGERSSGFANISAVLGTWVSIIGASVGGYMALQTYHEEVSKMEDARVVQTFQLFQMFNTGERLSARRAIFDYIKAKAHGDADAHLEPNDVYIFVDFYDALQICVERSLCDRDLSIRLFQSYAVPVWDDMEDSLKSGRTDSDPNFAAGLEWMTQLYRDEAAHRAAGPAAQDAQPADTTTATTTATSQ
ncbi:MAG: hypothetical protein ABUS57_07075 [Pseudomonadota bacterium]